MKNTLIIIVILILIALGVYMFMGNSGNVEAPTYGMSGTENEEGYVPAPNAGSTSVVTTTTVTTATVKEFTVTGTNFKFNPATITVNKGDRVKITFNNTQGFHDFVIDGYGVATKQLTSPATEVIEFTADKAGSFEYYCSVGSHKSMGMVGTLKVI